MKDHRFQAALEGYKSFNKKKRIAAKAAKDLIPDGWSYKIQQTYYRHGNFSWMIVFDYASKPDNPKDEWAFIKIRWPLVVSEDLFGVDKDVFSVVYTLPVKKRTSASADLAIVERDLESLKFVVEKIISVMEESL